MKTALALFLAMFAASAFGLDVKSGSVEWTASSTAGLVKIKGKGGVPTGSVQVADGKASGVFECELSAFDTGIGERNDHMRDKYLDVKNHPKAKLELDPVAVSDKDFDWTGKLTLKGETKPVNGKGRVKGDALWAEFVISLADYPAVGVPSFKDITVAKDVTIVVKAKVGQ